MVTYVIFIVFLLNNNIFNFKKHNIHQWLSGLDFGGGILLGRLQNNSLNAAF